MAFFLGVRSMISWTGFCLKMDSQKIPTTQLNIWPAWLSERIENRRVQEGDDMEKDELIGMILTETMTVKRLTGIRMMTETKVKLVTESLIVRRETERRTVPKWRGRDPACHVARLDPVLMPPLPHHLWERSRFGAGCDSDQAELTVDWMRTRHWPIRTLFLMQRTRFWVLTNRLSIDAVLETLVSSSSATIKGYVERLELKASKVIGVSRLGLSPPHWSTSTDTPGQALETN